MQVDLPALERPTKAISGTSSRGKCFSSGAVVKNLAVCSQPMAILGPLWSGLEDALDGALEEALAGGVMVGWSFTAIPEGQGLL